MSTPLEPAPSNAYTDFPSAEYLPAPTEKVIDPDDPPWGVGTGIFVWMASVALLLLMSMAAIIIYFVMRAVPPTSAEINAAVQSDPTLTLYSLISMIPTHALTLVLVWIVVTNYGKRPFWQTIGWSWSPRVGFWTSAGLAVLLLVLSAVAINLFGSGLKTELDIMLESSVEARFLTAFLAVAGAPLVEEIVYRGVLYPALQRAFGVFWSVIVVSTLFAVVHVAQYYNNPAVIFAVGMLGFVLTYVRARTGRVLPCFVIHLVFNGIQAAFLIAEHFIKKPDEAGTQTGSLITSALQFLPDFFIYR